MRVHDSSRTNCGVGSIRRRDESGPMETRTWFALSSGTVRRTWSSKGTEPPCDVEAEGEDEDEDGEVVLAAALAVDMVRYSLRWSLSKSMSGVSRLNYDISSILERKAHDKRAHAPICLV